MSNSRGEIESTLRSFTQIDQAVVMLVGTAPEDKRLLAWFTASKKVASSDLRHFLGRSLPPYMIPSQFMQLDAFPLSTNGKLDRKALPDVPISSGETVPAYISPETEIEEMLTELWAEVLSLEKIGTMDHFLELGGHSLTAVRLVSRINETFDIQLPLNQVFELPTIKLQAEAITDKILELMDEMEG